MAESERTFEERINDAMAFDREANKRSRMAETERTTEELLDAYDGCVESSPVWHRARQNLLAHVAVLEAERDSLREIAGFVRQLDERAVPRHAALVSLLERVREFVDEFCRNGSKTGRADYTRITPLDAFEPLRIAYDEFKRFDAAMTPEPKDASA